MRYVVDGFTKKYHFELFFRDIGDNVSAAIAVLTQTACVLTSGDCFLKCDVRNIHADVCAVHFDV
jgi:hypothetical protein